MPYVHPFFFIESRHDSYRELKIHQQREAVAMLEIVGAFQRDGYEHGESLLNFPPTLDQPPTQQAAVDVDHVKPDDVLVTVTRPALHDQEVGGKRKLPRGYTDLEEKIFEVWLEHLEVCSRQEVRLAAAMRQEVAQGFEMRRSIGFRMKGQGAYYRDWNDRAGSGWKSAPRAFRTAGYLVRREALWQGGPAYLGIFGVDGASAVVWAWQLRHRLPELLRRPGFAMVELTCEQTVPSRPTDLAWAGAWKAEMVVDHRL